MPDTASVIQGLSILQKYRDEPDGFHIGADHDVIYAYPTDEPVSDDDLTGLISLGWYQEDADWGDSEEFQAEHYSITESWWCRV